MCVYGTFDTNILINLSLHPFIYFKNFKTACRAFVHVSHLFVGPPVSHNAPLLFLGVHVKPVSHRLGLAADNMAAVEVAFSSRRVR